MATDNIEGSHTRDKVYLGSGSQSFDAGNGWDTIISLADAGEPDPAQTDGADGRVDPPIEDGAANDTLIGGAGGDRFEFHALLDAKDEVIAQHTREDGSVNWAAVAGENDNVHDHWVAGWGEDTIADYNKEEGDKIVVRGHTVEIADISYGEDEGGTYSLITVISQQGNGGAGGANTETGAHDEDPVGRIKVYGDEVTEEDVIVQRDGVVDGIDRLERTDEANGELADDGATQVVFSNTDGDSYSGSFIPQTDKIYVGTGSQTVNAGGGNDYIRSFSDGGEPDPAQTDGSDGRVNPALPDGAGDDVFSGGQGQDTFLFNFLLNAKEEILAKHTNGNGKVNWVAVAHENENVHDHWVEGIGDDTILDFSNQDGDKIELRGHTVEVADIVYGEDEGGDFSLIIIRSQQGDGGGAHDEDPLGTLKVYGDKVTEEDIKVSAAGVFDGIDMLEGISEAELSSPADKEAPVVSQIEYGAENPEDIDLTFIGTLTRDILQAGSGSQTVYGGAGRDHLISWGDAGEPDPAQTEGGEGRVNPALPDGASDDVFHGGSGADTFEFRALLNAKREVIETYTGRDGRVNWKKVAGENDNVHDHWVQGIGEDTILDYNKEEGDKIVVRGHTVEISEITYGEDEGGAYSLVHIISQQGDGGAGGANTETGAHDEDGLGRIKIYGSEVTIEDIIVKRDGVFDGADRLEQADKLADFNGGVQTFVSKVHGDTIDTQDASVRVSDYVIAVDGAQDIKTGAGKDVIVLASDGGEPDPAQTDGADGRVNPPVAPGFADDTVSGGQGKDFFTFNLLLNATSAIIAKHTRKDGSVNWKAVAHENGDVHLHWVEAIGNDTVMDYSKQDNDQIIIRGHTVEIADIIYDEDENGQFSQVILRSQQGDGGGAHDEDPLGSIKFYGDEVTEEDIIIQAAGVFDGIDQFDLLPASGDIGLLTPGTNGSDTITGVHVSEIIHGFGGKDLIEGNGEDDYLFGGSGRDTVDGGDGNDWLESGRGRDLLIGGEGDDTLVATGGRDRFEGGEGSDTFVMTDLSAGLVITDFEDGVDLIDFSRIDSVEGVDDLAFLQINSKKIMVAYVDENEELVGVKVTGDTGMVLDETDFLF